jgi:predicted glycoside hydrolase/deacetylase ChbG (UPF0249 family)
MYDPDSKRQLIITADDCGLSEGINDATYALHVAGLVTTATVMMNVPATTHALDMLAVTPTLYGGVHLNLTDGYPLTDVATSVGLTLPDGQFQPRSLLFARAVFPTENWLWAVEQEMRAQIDLYIQLTGRKPNHLTTHMHFHMLPSLRALVMRLAGRYGIGWVRAFQTSSTIIPYNFFVQAPDELFRPDNLKITPDYIASLQAWLSQEPDRLAETIMGLRGLIELVVHPDHENDHTYPAHMSHKPAARAREQAYLVRLGEALTPYRHALHIGDPAYLID